MGVRKYNIGDVFSHPVYGEYTIIGHKNRVYTIQFKNTGYIGKTRADYITINRVKDYMYPNIYGIGYLGDANIYRANTREYHIWLSMISNVKKKEEFTICKEWLCFKTFLEELKEMENYDKLKMDGYAFSILNGEREYNKGNCYITLFRNVATYARVYMNNTLESFGIEYLSKYNVYAARLSINNKKIHLGRFDTLNAAANAIDNYLLLYYEETDTEIPLHDVEYTMSIDECIKACHTDIYKEKIKELIKNKKNNN